MHLLHLVLFIAACAPSDAPTAAPGGGDPEAEAETGSADGADGADGLDGGDSGGTNEDDGPPPVVVLFIGDGMGFEHVAAAGLVATGDRDGLTLSAAPLQRRSKTASISGFTDSAAAATTLATGQRVPNGVIAQGPDGEALTTLLDLATRRGMAVGVVTTDTVLGATPASFLLHAGDRHDGEALTGALPGALPDLLVGGGAGPVLPLLDVEAAQVVSTAADLRAATPDGRPLVGLISSGPMPFEVDRDPAVTLSQAELVDVAFDHLEGDPDGMLLVFEGARIDHASHLNQARLAITETVALDAAVARALERVALLPDRPGGVVVTADHETGGLQVLADTPAGEVPPVTWRWFDHTNADVGLWAWGEVADQMAALPEGRLDHRWVYAALAASVTGDDVVAPPDERIADGQLDDLGPVVVTQTRETDFGAGYNQLDGLRVAADREGLWVGVDGAFDGDANAVVVYVDLDFGAGTGVGAEFGLSDPDGRADALLSRLVVAPTLEGLGFDAAAVSVAGEPVRAGVLTSGGGLRLFRPPNGEADDLWWLDATLIIDDGNRADGGPARDAGSVGATRGGLELRLPWTSLAPEGLPPEGAELGIFVALVDTFGTVASNQALPAWPSADAPDPTALPVGSVVTLTVGADGAQIGDPGQAP